MAPDFSVSRVVDTIKRFVIPDENSEDETEGNLQSSYFKFLAASADADEEDDTEAEESLISGGSSLIEEEDNTEADLERLRENLQHVMGSNSEEEVDFSVKVTDVVRERLGATGQEKLLGQVSAWLLTDVLCQGKALLSTNHVYFYAPLPYSGSHVIMEGTLRKRSTTGVGFSRYWYILRQDTLAHYNSSDDPYFPVGIISLSTIKYVSHEPKDSGEPSSSLYLVSDDEVTYHLKADSSNNAHQWAKAIQKAIFVSRNCGEYAKAVLPFENILSVAMVPVLDVATSMRISYIPGPGETAAEVVLVFFKNGREATESTIKYWKLKVGDENVVERADGKKFWSRKNPKVKVMEKSVNTMFFSGRSHVIPEHITENLIVSPKEDPTAADVIQQRIVDTGSSVVSGTSSVVKGSLGLFSLSKVVSSHIKQVATDWIPERDKLSVSVSQSERPSVSGSPNLSPVSSRTDVDLDEAVKRAAAQRKDEEDFDRSAPSMLSRIFNASASVVSSDSKADTDYEMHIITPEEQEEASERFQAQFSFGRRVKLLSYYKCLLQRGSSNPMGGLLFLTNQYLCFKRAIITSRTRMVLPIENITRVEIVKKSSFGYFGVRFHIRGSDPIYAEITTEAALQQLVKALNTLIKEEKEHGLHHTGDTAESVDFVRYELIQARMATYEDQLSNKMEMRIPPLVVDPYSREANEAFLNRPSESLRITILTIGSRGDVQPYIALCQGLMQEGHKCRICTHSEFRDFVEGYGIEFRDVAGDPKALMQIMIDHGSFTLSFLKEAASKFRSWVSELLESAWIACQDSDVLIESPSAMAGLHIAEALGIPYFRAFTMPWTRTHAYPHAFIVPESNLGGSYNYMTYVMFENMMWRGTASQINKWRKKTLGIRSTNLENMRQQQIPFLYCVSPHVLVPPIDEPDWIHYTGYWQLEHDDTYEPPEALVTFMKKAREDKKPLVYIGFGSIVVDDVDKLTSDVIEGVEKAGVRAVVVKGWAERSSDGSKIHGEKEMPKDIIYSIDSIPHQWLFPQVDAAVHHGGSGTTGMSLSCGVPTIIKPFFGDQFFYATRVSELGCGLALKKISGEGLAKVLIEATTNKSIIERAHTIGEQISLENGVMTAIQCIYRELSYAQSLIYPRKEIAHHASHHRSRSLHGIPASRTTSSSPSRTATNSSEDIRGRMWSKSKKLFSSKK